MRRILKKLVIVYFVVTVVMAINICLGYVAFNLLSVKSETSGQPPANIQSWENIPGLTRAQGDRAILQQNLGMLDLLCQRDAHVDLRVLLEYCGEPDGYKGDLHADLHLIYYYNRFGDKDWVAYVTLTHGFMSGIGYNDSSVNDHSAYKKWDIDKNDIPTYQ